MKNGSQFTTEADFESMLKTISSLKTDELTDAERKMTSDLVRELKKSTKTTSGTCATSKKCVEDIDSITKTLLPKLETSCKSVEEIFNMVDSMEALMVQVKFSVAEAESRASVFSKERSDGSVIANFLTNILTQASKPVQGHDRRKNKGPLSIFKTKDHPGVFRKVKDANKD